MKPKEKTEKKLNFFGKIYPLFNNEDNFIQIDEEEIRFGLSKLNP